MILRIALLLTLWPAAHWGAASTALSTYQAPPSAMAALVDQPQTPRAELSPRGRNLLLLEVPPVLAIDDLARPELKIGGLRIDPSNNGPSRARYYTAIKRANTSDGSHRTVEGLPNPPRIRNVKWSPDGAAIAFTLDLPDRIELWAVDVSRASARKISDVSLNEAVGSPYEWLPDSSGFVARAIPSDRGEPPVPPATPTGPVIRETGGRKAAARTYQDLLKNPHDAALFEHYLTSTVLIISREGVVSPAGPEGLVVGATPSPDGRFILTETLHRPFSYLVPWHRFPNRIEVWDRAGNRVYQVADLPVQEEVPIEFDGVPTGPRSVHWRADAAATLAWVEARDGGDPKAPAEVRDEVLMAAAPFERDPSSLVKLPLRYAGLTWGHDGLALVSARWWDDRRIQTWTVAPGNLSSRPGLLFDRSWEDRYGDPGRPMTRRTKAGTRVLVMDGRGRTIFLAGEGASPEGNRPFVDRLQVDTKETERLWRSEPPQYEVPLAFIDVEKGLLLTRRESQSEPPNYYSRDIFDAGARQLLALTQFPHPTPGWVGVRKELIRYQRVDGVSLTATLYTPPGWREGRGPLPVLLWAYPREFKDPTLAGQVTDSPHRFVRVSYWGALPMLTQGWAVLDNPAMPIIGQGDTEPNDTYIQQLVSSAEAAIDELVRRGIGEKGRIAIGGHSYGAFMTANLLAHSDLFAAGIARSGAFNRSLTPFGFQAEQRTFWEAPEIYFKMSPFMNADTLDEPILLIHGAEDNNSGTFPLQSERMYHALKGLGGSARLVMLPEESHGYVARESLLHMLWEQNEWLQRWIPSR